MNCAFKKVSILEGSVACDFLLFVVDLCLNHKKKGVNQRLEEGYEKTPGER